MPLVSVIIPTRDRAALLADAIDSVLQQTFTDFELIVVDDGSTDHTAELVSSYRDPRIVYFHQQGKERGAARNQGVALSRGEFITFLDDDDWYLPHKLQVQARAMRAAPDLGMVIGGWDRVNALGEVVRSERPWLHHPRMALQDWLFAAMAHVAAVLIRRSWFDQVGGFNHDLRQAEDTYLWFRLAQVGCPVAWTKAVVFKQRLHGDNSVHNMGHVKQGKLAMLELIFRDKQVVSALDMTKESAYGRVYMGFACREYAAGCSDDAKADLAHAVAVDPSLTHNEADRLLEIVAAYAWNHLTDDPFAFTVRVFSHLPDELAYLYPLKNRAIARTWTVGAFRAFQYNDMRRVRQNALRALMVSPTLVRNRGLMSILVRSLMSLRQMKHREAAAQDAAALADG